MFFGNVLKMALILNKYEVKLFILGNQLNYNPVGGEANAWDYISVASGYPAITGTWAYNSSGEVA